MDLVVDLFDHFYKIINVNRLITNIFKPLNSPRTIIMELSLSLSILGTQHFQKIISATVEKENPHFKSSRLHLRKTLFLNNTKKKRF